MYNQSKYKKIKLRLQAKRICLALLSFACTFPLALLSMENNGRGTKAIGMANAFVAVADNGWAMNYNPAGLSQIRNIQCSFFLVPNQFGLQELRTNAFAITIPISFMAAAFKIEKFGFELYRETEYGAAGSFHFDKNISCGVSLNYHRLDIARYGHADYLTFNAGILACVVNTVKFGFRVDNITRATFGKNHEAVPQNCSVGMSGYLLDDLLASVEMEKDIRYPASLHWGIEQDLLSVIKVRVGVSNNPQKYSAGIAVSYSLLEFGYAGYSHTDLGWTNQIDVTVAF